MEKRGTILLVDDEWPNILALNEILSPEYEILYSKSGDAAIRLAGENKPDIILLDVLMPEMNGFEVLAELKASEETAAIPVIFITGLDDEHEEENGFLHGVVDYIKKPFSSIVVKARVSMHIQFRQQLLATEEISKTDPLTGLPNRRKFEETLEREWNRALRVRSPIAFMMMDIDKFKTYNADYGHPQGDELLKASAWIFASAARRPEDLAARLGGEEFGLLLPNTNLENALIVAEKVRAAMQAARILTQDQKIMTAATISIGVVSFIPKLQDTIRDFIGQAAKNLHAAQETGRNKVCWGD
ncbi:MAG: diguanylate cyclase [Candidatus Adiutrix sp.]|jgi:diguanylate cyclase (GGDEF)-like protein|nr:diguanylate cyclase [Candidatus Adiutrix sp.]